MFRHPTVVAAIILSAGMIVSALLLCIFIHALDSTLQGKPMAGVGASVNFPDHMTIGTGNSSFDIRVRSTEDKPFQVKQMP